MKKQISIELLFLIIISFYAIISTSGWTIAWGVMPLLYGFFQTKNIFEPIDLKKIYVGLLLFILIFILNLFVVYDFDLKHIKLPHPDFDFYLKVASTFNQTGIENNLTAKTVLFPELNMATPYRFFDTWLLGFLLQLPFSNLETLQLIYMPFLYFIVSFSVFKNLFWINNVYIKIFLSIAFIFLFGDYVSNWLVFSNENIGEMCVISYPKLSIFFGVFIYYFRHQFNENKHNAILILALLPILIQVSFPIYLFIYIYLIFNYKYFLENRIIPICIFISTLYYFIFYIYNSYLFHHFFTMEQFQTVKSITEYVRRILSISYNELKSKLLFFGLLLAIIYSLSTSERRVIYLRILFFASIIIFSGIIIYALLPSSPNSYQFLTNFTFPLFITIIFFIIIDFLCLKTLKWQVFGLFFAFILIISSAYNQYYGNCFFGITGVNDKIFVEESLKILKVVENKIGITYWSSDFEKSLEKRSHSESFNQHGTNFLIKANGNFDVVCLSSLNNNSELFANKLNKYYSAISIFQRKFSLKDSNIESNFYKKYKFNYLITDLKKESLPLFLKKDISRFCFDYNTKIYFYQLKTK